MIPATDPVADYHALVRRGYDACARAYHEARKTQAPTELRELVDRLEAAAEVLDLGCGAGVPIARSLAVRHHVTGVDISQAMVDVARRNVPAGDFICADITSIDFNPASFDAVVAICSIFHLPRAEQPALFRKVHRWLRPGGYFLCTLSHHSEAGYTEDGFFGVTMYWSNYALSEYLDTLALAGFTLVEISSTADGKAATMHANCEDHPLVLARKH